MTPWPTLDAPAAAPPVVAPAIAPPAAAPVRASAGWLALRRAADAEARDRGAARLLSRLEQHLRTCGVGALRVVDLGAGTGANRAYLSPRLALAQDWVVVDHDAELLADAGHGDALRVEAGVCDLEAVLAVVPPRPDDRRHGLPARQGKRRHMLPARHDDRTRVLLTCAALLDVLDAAELGCLADAVERAGGPALLSLSVTGHVRWSPRDPGDAVLRRAFDAHQRRGGRPGPDAVRVLRKELLGRGLAVMTARTPWTLDARRPELLARWLAERVEAATEQAPDQADLLAAWHRRRQDQVGSGRLVVRVEHEDLLALPR